MAAKPVNQQIINAKNLIGALLIDIKTINWGMEIKMAKRLLQNFPNGEFWKLPQIHKYKSLMHVIKNKEALFYIAEEYQKFVKENTNLEVKRETAIIFKEKLGEDADIKIQRKPTMLEFIDKYI